jgi:arylformamidase
MNVRERAVKVYRDFDQKALDREYSARDTVSPDSFEATIKKYSELSAHARATLTCRLDVSYGAHPDSLVDIFPAGRGAPILLFVHGGYWRMLSQKESAFMAPAFAGRGVTTVTVNYSLAPKASLDEIVRQCRAALAWTYRRAPDFGADPERIVICGSSAGGHLVGMLLSAGWHDEFKVPTNVVKGACALSGIFDLEPIRLAEPNSWIKLDRESAQRNSPIHHIPKSGGCPLIVSYGGNETAEFKRQTDEYAAAWRARGFKATHVEMNHTNHFDITLDLCSAGGKLTSAVLGLLGK